MRRASFDCNSGVVPRYGTGCAYRYTIRRRTRPRFPQVFRWWSVWAVLEVASWLHSPQIRAGIGEIKHLLLIAGLFLVLPSLHRLDDRMAVWRGIFVAASLGSAALVCGLRAASFAIVTRSRRAAILHSICAPGVFCTTG